MGKIEKDRIRKAIQYLEHDRFSHIDMLEVIHRGTATILHADTDGVLLLEESAQLYLMSSYAKQTGKRFMEQLKEPKLIATHQKFCIDLMIEKFGLKHTMSCYQAIWTKKEPPKVLSTRIHLHWLTIDFENEVGSLYSHDIGKDYIRDRLLKGEILGAFVKNELVGFIGLHEEGAMGMLEVKDPYRKKGIASQLISHMCKYQINRGRIPFSQVEVDNIPSQRLHEQLGFERSKNLVFWLEQ